MMSFSTLFDAISFLSANSAGECFVLVHEEYFYWDGFFLRHSRVNELAYKIGYNWKTVLTVIAESNETHGYNNFSR